VTLSWGGPGEIPHRHEAGKRQLEQAFGVSVVEMPHTLASPDFLAKHPQARVDDLHAAIADPEIAGIISTIGGDDSIRLLPLIDLELVAAHPKIFLGYSDATTTQMAFLKAGVVCFYGPSIMAGFGENGGLLPYLEDGVRRMLFEPEAPLEWPQNGDGWTVEFVDWHDPENQSRSRAMRRATGWRWHGGESAEGLLIVGCLEVLDWLRGTAWWPDLDGAVLAIETSEEAPTPEAVRGSSGPLPRWATSPGSRRCSWVAPAARTCRSRIILATTRPSSASSAATASSTGSQSRRVSTSGTQIPCGPFRKESKCGSIRRPARSHSSNPASRDAAERERDANTKTACFDGIAVRRESSCRTRSPL
jgi:muramoyltetrapeptide carboxypeptidase LdcA involved in peptidoglycan recycling